MIFDFSYSAIRPAFRSAAHATTTPHKASSRQLLLLNKSLFAADPEQERATLSIEEGGGLQDVDAGAGHVDAGVSETPKLECYLVMNMLPTQTR